MATQQELIDIVDNINVKLNKVKVTTAFLQNILDECRENGETVIGNQSINCFDSAVMTLQEFVQEVEAM